MNISHKIKKYPAYTLLEMLVVMSILMILSGMTFSAFDGLQNTVKLNEYMLTLEQDIRSVQRSAMLLERNTDERWIYGLGIDFSEISEDGKYHVFKWCSPYEEYGDITTKSKLPAYDPSKSLGEILGNDLRNGYLTIPVNQSIYMENKCDLGSSVSEMRSVPGYDKSTKTPKSNINISSSITYVLFESVSGRAFFYDSEGNLVNYAPNGEHSTPSLNFDLEIIPQGKGSTRKLSISNLSGKISTYMYK